MYSPDMSSIKQALSLNNPRFLLYGFMIQVAVVSGLVSIVLHAAKESAQPVVIMCQGMASLLTIGLVVYQVYIMCSGGHSQVNNDKVFTILGLNIILSTASIVAPVNNDKDHQVLIAQIVSAVSYAVSAVLYVFTVASFRGTGWNSPCHSVINVPAPVLGGFVPLVQTPLPTYKEFAKEEVCMPPSYSQVCLDVVGTSETQTVTGSSPPPAYTLQVD